MVGRPSRWSVRAVRVSAFDRRGGRGESRRRGRILTGASRRGGVVASSEAWGQLAFEASLDVRAIGSKHVGRTRSERAERAPAQAFSARRPARGSPPERCQGAWTPAGERQAQRHVLVQPDASRVPAAARDSDVGAPRGRRPHRGFAGSAARPPEPVGGATAARTPANKSHACDIANRARSTARRSGIERTPARAPSMS